jgi:hypothetical protein
MTAELGVVAVPSEFPFGKKRQVRTHRGQFIATKQACLDNSIPRIKQSHETLDRFGNQASLKPIHAAGGGFR